MVISRERVTRQLVEEAAKQHPVDNNSDIPQVVFRHIEKSTVHAQIVAVESGIVAGIARLEQAADELELKTVIGVSSGFAVQAGDVIAQFTGNPIQIVRGEDVLLGTIAKSSGIATAAHIAVARAGSIRVVCGGWKKLPRATKDELRQALQVGGVDIRMVAAPFLYLDKNYVRIFGSLENALQRAEILPGRTVVIQLRGETAPIAEEAIFSARHGVQILMVDTGRIADLKEVSLALKRNNLRAQVKIAFGGNITLDEVAQLQNEDLDIVDIGRAILDAPLLDFRYDVVQVEG